MPFYTRLSFPDVFSSNEVFERIDLSRKMIAYSVLPIRRKIRRKKNFIIYFSPLKGVVKEDSRNP